MAKYVDGFVMVIPKGKEEEYRKMAEEGRDSWMRHGALQYFECKGDDFAPQEGDDSRPFPTLMATSGDEEIWYSFIIFESKEKRDEVNKKVMDEMGETYASQPDFKMPFDTKRMSRGGFTVAVEG